MNKVLTPLEHLQFIRNYEIDEEHTTLNMQYATKQSLDIIENALKDYELEHNLRIGLENINYKLVKEVRESISKTKLLKYLNWLIDENEFDIKIATQFKEKESVIINNKAEISLSQYLIKMINEGNFDNE